MEPYFQFIPNDLTERYEFLNYNHAVEILANSFPTEWNEIISALHNLHSTRNNL